jgi:hypothetical protein
MYLVKKSMNSGKLCGMELPITQEELDNYYAGGNMIQSVFPHLTADQREFILTGITPEEWEEMFAEDDQ